MNYDATLFAGNYLYNQKIAALDANRNVLETYLLHTSAPINTPFATNDGAFRGFQRSSADIRYVALTGYLLMHDITVAGAASDPGTTAAEPDGLSLATAGIVLLAGLSARRYAVSRR